MAELRRLADTAGRATPRVSVQVYGDPPDPRVIEKYLTLGVDRIDLTAPHAAPGAMLDAIARLGRAMAPWMAGRTA